MIFESIYGRKFVFLHHYKSLTESCELRKKKAYMKQIATPLYVNISKEKISVPTNGSMMSMVGLVWRDDVL